MTLIGSSTNILVSGVLHDLGLKELGFFEFSSAGLLLMVVGILYITLILPKFIPDRASFMQTYTAKEGENREFIAQLEIESNSSLLGDSISSGYLDSDKNITIKMLIREEHAFLPPFDSSFVIKRSDTIVITANKDEFLDFISLNKCTVEKHLTRLAGANNDEGKNEDIQLAEIVVTPTSWLIDSTLAQSHFSTRSGCTVLGVQRQSQQIRSKITSRKINAGDVLLVMGSKENILQLQNGREFLLLELLSQNLVNNKSKITMGIFAGVISLAAFNILPIAKV